MSELTDLVTNLGPATGAIVMLGLAVWRGLLPYYRDTYLPARLKAQQDMATAMKDIGDIARETNTRLEQLSNRFETVAVAQAEAAQDMAGVYALMRAQRPSRAAQTALGKAQK